MERRVVITGLGLLSPLGIGKEPFWQSLVEGRSGIRRLTRFDPAGYDCQIAGEIPDESYKDQIEPKRLRRMTDVAQLAVAGAQLALADADLSPSWAAPYSVGVIIGSSTGSFKEGMEQQAIMMERGMNRVNHFMTTASIVFSIISSEVAVTVGAQGPSFTMSGACASSLYSIGVATDLIRSGALDVCFTGGVEAPLTPMVIACLSHSRELATMNEAPEQASRPFDHRHNGLVPSEGSCILVLEDRAHAERRGALIYGEILGHALGCEAYDTYKLEVSGDRAVPPLQEALRRAHLAPTEIEWINAHGSSCPEWDRKETRVLKKALGGAAYAIPISGTKSVMGHSFGAAAAFQVASAVLAMQQNCLLPTINLDVPDPECDLNYVRHAVPSRAVQTCLVNSFGYGGLISFLLLGKS